MADAGMNLLLAKGFNATTVEGICSAADVTKGYFLTQQTPKRADGRERAKDYQLFGKEGGGFDGTEGSKAIHRRCGQG